MHHGAHSGLVDRSFIIIVWFWGYWGLFWLEKKNPGCESFSKQSVYILLTLSIRFPVYKFATAKTLQAQYIP